MITNKSGKILKSVADWAIVEVLQDQSMENSEGVLIPTSDSLKEVNAVVITCGDGTVSYPRPDSVSEGSEVLISKSAGSDFSFNGKMYKRIRFIDIIGVWENTTNK